MAVQSVPVRLEMVSKTFRDPKTKAEVHAVRDADFEIQPGELVTLLGPSGCGKTTTAAKLALLLMKEKKKFGNLMNI